MVGGARSGKSEHAEALLKRTDNSVTYLATARTGESNMQDRIRRHKENRPDSWNTIEPDYDLSSVTTQLRETGDDVLLDGLGLLVSSFVEVGQGYQSIRSKIEDMLANARNSGSTWVIVSSLVNRGVIPTTPEGRGFRDLMGRINQQLSEAANRVDEVTVGIPRTLKGPETGEE